MDRDTFWKLIEESKARSSGFSEHADTLKEMLKALPSAEIESFQAIFDELFHAAYRWDLWRLSKGRRARRIERTW